MNREIKFRAKDYQTNKWVYGFLFMGKCDDNRDYAFILQDKGLKVGVAREDNAIEFPCDEAHLVDKETICQYTGFKDMNDKEIYEGDIIRDFHSFYFSGDFTKKIRGAYAVTQDKDEPIPVVSYCRNYAVEWGKRGSYILRNGSDQHPLCTRFRGVEVLGNIFDNPDLVEQ